VLPGASKRIASIAHPIAPNRGISFPPKNRCQARVSQETAQTKSFWKKRLRQGDAEQSSVYAGCFGDGFWKGTVSMPVAALFASVITVAVGTIITDRPRTDPYERVYAYGSYEGCVA
jgi:hypothetical protein